MLACSATYTIGSVLGLGFLAPELPHRSPTLGATRQRVMGERMAGPLSDVRILELAGLGALPYGSLRLAAWAPM